MLPRNMIQAHGVRMEGLGTFSVFLLLSWFPVTCIITTNDLGWWHKLCLFLLQTERSGWLCWEVSYSSCGASEQHLAMSTVLCSSGQFMLCTFHGASIALLSCPAGPSGRWIPGRVEAGCREAPVQGLCTQSDALAAPWPHFFWTRQSFKMALSYNKGFFVLGGKHS